MLLQFYSLLHVCYIGWLESVGSRVVFELDYKKPILYVIPIQSILGKPPVVPVGDTGTNFLALPATDDWELAMDARCGSSTRGLWDGPGTCNESQGVETLDDAWRKVLCDLDASPCLGHAIVCSAWAVPILLGSSGSAWRI